MAFVKKNDFVFTEETWKTLIKVKDFESNHILE